MDRAAHKLAHSLVKTMRDEHEKNSKHISPQAEMGRVVKYSGGVVYIDPDNFDSVLDSSCLELRTTYTPVVGDRVLLIPLVSGNWAVIDKF